MKQQVSNSQMAISEFVSGSGNQPNTPFAAFSGVKYSDGIDRSHSIPEGHRRTYEVTPGITTKDSKCQAQLRCPSVICDKIRYRSLLNHLSMNQIVLESLMEADMRESWDIPPAEFAGLNDQSLVAVRGKWEKDVHGYNTKDLDSSMPIRMPEGLYLKLKWRSLQIRKSVVEIMFTIVMDGIIEEDWEEAPEWCKRG